MNLRSSPKLSPRLRRKRGQAPKLFVEPEKRFQAQVVALAKLSGWSVFFTHRSEGSPSGWPDLVLIRPPRVLFWELKSDLGKLTVLQAACLELLAQCAELAAAEVRPSDWTWVQEELR